MVSTHTDVCIKILRLYQDCMVSTHTDVYIKILRLY